MNMPIVPDNVIKMWADPRFQVYADVIKLLEGSRVWGGMGWSYHYIIPEKYLPVKDQVRKALDDLYKEYGVEE
jgi:hypothetical protein